MARRTDPSVKRELESLAPLFRDTEIGQQIFKAFQEPDEAWRTLGGIARASGLETSEIQTFIHDYSPAFVEAPLQLGGTAVYSLRPEIREILSGGAAIS